MRVFVAGASGMVGGAVARLYRMRGDDVLVTRIELRDQTSTYYELSRINPDLIILAAAKVGGINANIQAPAEFIYDNLMIQANVIHSAHLLKIPKVVLLGSSCIYPRDAPQPMRPEHLLTGPLEPTNESYAIAKIAGIKMGQAYSRQYGMNIISLMPTNLYGPGDNYDLEKSHVIPALIRRFHEAKMNDAPTVELWGTGTVRREFLYVDDLARAIMLTAHVYNGREPLNVGYGLDFRIDHLAAYIAGMVGYKGEIVWDESLPDGPERKMLDSSKIRAMSWAPRVDMGMGLKLAYGDFLKRSEQ